MGGLVCLNRVADAPLKWLQGGGIARGDEFYIAPPHYTTVSVMLHQKWIVLHTRAAMPDR